MKKYAVLFAGLSVALPLWASDIDKAQVKLEPVKEVVSFSIDGKEMGPLPAIFLIPENATTFTLEFRKKGYEPIKETLTKRFDGWFAGEGHIPDGSRIGLTTDFSKGVVYIFNENQTKQVIKELKKQGYNTKAVPGEGFAVVVDWATVKLVVHERYENGFSPGSYDIDH